MTLEIGVLALVALLQIAVVYRLFMSGKPDPADVVKQTIEPLEESLSRITTQLDLLNTTLREENSQNRKEARDNEAAIRKELNQSIKSFGDTMEQRLHRIGTDVDKQLRFIQKDNTEKVETMRTSFEKRMEQMQGLVDSRLEKMRLTVDEKLHATLEKRLGESFKLVGERLELVHKGLGEMQQLASGVGDLKKVLTNVKTRGTWGEVQLKNLLEQVLTPDQYAENIATKNGSRDRVEFAIKLPGKSDEINHVYIPIDAKFPIEDYQRLVSAQEAGAREDVDTAVKALEQRIKLEAKTIHDKYLDPPYTTDFGILYVPVEGLYAEITQRQGLAELLQREYRVLVCGPNTIAALLNSLQMGFRTLAIEKRSSEVWEILGAVKTEFGKFGDLLEKTKKKIQEAGNTIDFASRKSRTIERKLDKVQGLPSGGVEEQAPKLDEPPLSALPFDES